MPMAPKTHRWKHQGKRLPDTRPSASARGYDSRWQRARRLYLAQRPLCATCETNGQTTLATVVDHIRPHKGDMRLFWDETNWQPLCKRHHDQKTATEDGGFGREAGPPRPRTSIKKTEGGGASIF